MLAWESPKCPGWEQDLVYTLKILTEESLTERSTDGLSYTLPESIKGVVNVSVCVENSCGENTLLDTQLVNTDSTGTGELTELSILYMKHSSLCALLFSTGGLAGGGSRDGGPSALEKSLMIFLFIGLALPILLLMIVCIVVAARKVSCSVAKSSSTSFKV